MTDSADELPGYVDVRLWIQTSGCTSRDFVWGNAHTYPGRMEAYCPHQRRDFAVSKNEVIDASTEARLWMDGFLRGQEPAGPEDEARRPAWHESIKAFHRTGVCEHNASSSD